MELEDIGKYGAGQLRFGSMILGGKQWGFPERYDMYKTESISLGDTASRGVIPWTVVGNVLMCNYNLLSDILWGGAARDAAHLRADIPYRWVQVSLPGSDFRFGSEQTNRVGHRHGDP